MGISSFFSGRLPVYNLTKIWNQLKSFLECCHFPVIFKMLFLQTASSWQLINWWMLLNYRWRNQKQDFLPENFSFPSLYIFSECPTLTIFFWQYHPNETQDKHKFNFMRESYFLMSEDYKITWYDFFISNYFISNIRLRFDLTHPLVKL